MNADDAPADLPQDSLRAVSGAKPKLLVQESIMEQPTRTLDAWMVFEAPFNGPDSPWTLHLVGWRVEGGRGQVSSPVECFDFARRLARTRSGRVYELRHGPGLNPDAFHTWHRWKAKHQLVEERELSDQVAALLEGHRG